MRDAPEDSSVTEATPSSLDTVTDKIGLGSLSRDSIKRKSVRGGAAAVLGQGAGMALQMTTTIVLARLLSPADYGLQSMVITLTAFVSLFKDAGLNFATVQRETMTNEQISTLFWINVALGAFLTIIVAAAAPLLAAFYREPRLLWLTVASASIFLFNSLSAQHRALLERAMRFSTSVKIDMLCALVGAIIAIAMAARGFGYWSLICQNISLPIVGMIATWIAMPWFPGKPRWTEDLREMLRFGGTITLNLFVVYIGYNAEKVLLGRYWGAAPLGIYGRAYQLATLPVQQFFGAVYVVAFSTLARVHGDSERLNRAYLKSQALFVSLLTPIVFTSAVFAKEIVQVVLGPNWTGVAVVLRFLAPSVLVLALVNPFSWLLQSSTAWVGRSLKMSFLIAPVVILGILIGIRRGPAGVALGYSTAMIALVVPLVLWALRGTGITVGHYWRSIRPPLVSGVVAAGTGWLAHLALAGAMSPIPLLALELATFLATYAGILLFVMEQKDLYLDLLGYLWRRPELSA
jgi:O-antigen/teichoic acid export membrane protein